MKASASLKPLISSPICLETEFRKCICCVPINIGMVSDGILESPWLRPGVFSKDKSLPDSAKIFDFGLHKAVLKSWQKTVKVVSSYGRQSTGKSYMLNHITGSQFDVSGGQCTDGACMQLQLIPECLYVVLDFKGVGRPAIIRAQRARRHPAVSSKY